MKTHSKRSPEFFTGTDGAPCARMPLSQPGTFALLNASAVQSLLRMGVSTNWFVNRHGYVAVNVPGTGPLPVARLVTGAGDGERVSYTDGDKLNLQLENLRVTRKNSRRVDLAALLERQAEHRQAREAARGQA